MKNEAYEKVMAACADIVLRAVQDIIAVIAAAKDNGDIQVILRLAEETSTAYRKTFLDANAAKAKKPAKAKDPAAVPEAAAPAPLSIDTLRSRLSDKMQEGKKAAVKDLLLKFGDGKLSSVAESDYQELYELAGEL